MIEAITIKTLGAYERDFTETVEESKKKKKSFKRQLHKNLNRQERILEG